jgi:hypothetical protein
MVAPKKFTLTDLLMYSRVVAVVLVVGAIGLTLWQFVAHLATDAINNQRLAALIRPQPNYAFGRLPLIRFPATTARPVSYRVSVPSVSSDGKSGWPGFGDRLMIEVYKLPPFAYSLNADQMSRQIASNLGFIAPPRILDERTSLFSISSPPVEESLQFDLKTLFFTFRTNYLTNTGVFGLIDIFGEKIIPTRTSALTAVREFLLSAGTLPADLSDADASVEFVTSVGSVLQPVRSVLEADYVTVSLPRAPIAGLVNGQPTTYRFYGPNNISSIYAVVGRDRTDRDIVVELQNYYTAFDLQEVGTYALRPVSDAWASVIAGDAYVINPRGVGEVNITSVELGYYQSHSEQEYLEPIYVFRGEGSVLIYTQALAANQLQ